MSQYASWIGTRTRLVATAGMMALAFSVIPAFAQATLGSAQSFAVLGASTVTNTGATVITGDLGVSPGTAITGFPPGTVVGGTIHAGDAVALQAHSDAAIAYAALVAETCDVNLTGQDLGGLTLNPGTYCFNTSAQLTGTLTLQGNGPWIFQIGSTLTTATGSAVVVNNTSDCDGTDVFWQVGSSATLGTATRFVGHLIALISVTVTTNVAVSGNVIALNGAVTMDTNRISTCGAGQIGPFPPHGAIKVTGGGQIAVPSPNNSAPDATGDGRATFGFNAQPTNQGGAKGHFNYVNHVTGLHVEGSVTAIAVIAVYPDGTPQTVRFSGTCAGTPACSFSVTVEDRGEPGTADRFSVTVSSGTSEVRSSRTISRGNIQFHNP